jgi:predicted Zn-dependent peptidase
MKKALTTILAVTFVFAALGLSQATRPSELKYPPLKYEPPDPKTFRTELGNGLRAYIQEDRSLPLVNVSALINFGSFDIPKDKTGLSQLLAASLIRGGTKSREGSAIEERIDFLGGTLNFMAGERTSQLTLSVLSRDLDEGLQTFFDVLMNPEFREDAVKLARARLIDQLRQSNDQPSAVLNREYERLLYGDQPLTWEPTKATYDGITVADLKAFHAKYFIPRNIILAASGDFVKADLKAMVDKLIRPWQNHPVQFPALVRTFPKPEPGVYFIQKATNQGYVSLGHLGLEDANSDYYAVQVMNFILGGGSFSSRITMKVRSNEGLSYNQGSRFSYRWGLPGTFAGYVQTKSGTVGYAISLILNEFDRIRKEPPTDAEMETAVNYYLESFADSFQTPQVTMTNFANLDMTGKPMDYYKTYRDRIKAVTKAKVLEVAQKYIRPEKMVILIVGDFDPCNKGGDKWAGPLDKLGPLHHLILRDPMTGQEPK